MHRPVPSTLRLTAQLLALTLLCGCASQGRIALPDAAFIARDMSGTGERWRPVRSPGDELWLAAERSGCMRLLARGERADGWLTEFEFRGHFFFRDSPGERFRVAAYHRLPEQTSCGELWTYEFCTFSPFREVSAGFWGIRGPRICLPSDRSVTDGTEETRPGAVGRAVLLPP